MKSFLLKIIYIISLPWKLIPSKIRSFIFTGLLLLESRGRDTSQGLKRLLLIKDRLEWIINERALKNGNGVHLKHRLINYHNFFIDNIKNGESVLDIGCGYGAVSRSVASSKPKSKIIAIDINKENIIKANSYRKIKNLKFMVQDANTDNLFIKSDVVILSNVLEHIENRILFLSHIKKCSDPKKILIRVPLFERDWQMPLRKELKINYFSDEDHKIEHTVDEFINELSSANVKIENLTTKWGEIWAVCHYE